MRGSQFNNTILARRASLEAAQGASCREGALQMASWPASWGFLFCRQELRLCWLFLNNWEIEHSPSFIPYFPLLLLLHNLIHSLLPRFLLSSSSSFPSATLMETAPSGSPTGKFLFSVSLGTLFSSELQCSVHWSRVITKIERRYCDNNCALSVYGVTHH